MKWLSVLLVMFLLLVGTNQGPASASIPTHKLTVAQAKQAIANAPAPVESKASVPIPGFPGIPAVCKGVSYHFYYGLTYRAAGGSRASLLAYPGRFCIMTGTTGSLRTVLYFTSGGHMILINCYRGSGTASRCGYVWRSAYTGMALWQFADNCMSYVYDKRGIEKGEYGYPGANISESICRTGVGYGFTRTMNQTDCGCWYLIWSRPAGIA